MSDDLVPALRELLADVLGLEPDEIPDDASSDTLEAWDSLRHLDVVMALEHRHGTNFTPDEVVAMRSIPGIVATLRAKTRP